MKICYSTRYHLEGALCSPNLSAEADGWMRQRPFWSRRGTVRTALQSRSNSLYTCEMAIPREVLTIDEMDTNSMLRQRALRMLAVGAVLAALGSCSSSNESEGTASEQCAATVEFNGSRYTTLHMPNSESNTILEAPDDLPVGRRLGEGIWPSCTEGKGEEGASERREVVSIEDVDAKLAVMVPGWSRRLIFLNADMENETLPAEVKELLD